MSNLLGCRFDIQNLNTTFQSSDQPIAVFVDPCHMLKLIRNTLGEKKCLVEGDGGLIKWEYIERLEQLQETEGLHLGNKLRKAHINFFKQKMKVRLAVQVLSASVADSLEYCKNQLALEDFQDCDATIKFIRIINKAFDILNSRTLNAYNFKQALCRDNIETRRIYIHEIMTYLSTLQFSNGELVTHSRRKTGFIGLIVSLNSALELYSYLIASQEWLIYLPIYKISQDHIELFFSSIRCRGGWNNNPTARQFMGSYKRLLMRTELRDGGLGNCVPLQQIPLFLLVISSRTQKLTPEEQINVSSTAYNQVPTNLAQANIDSLFSDHDYLMNTTVLTECSVQIVIYIAGFVVKHLQKVLHCETCIAVLIGEQDNFLNSLITQKNKGGLTYPAQDVISIYKKTEQYIRLAEKEGNLFRGSAVSSLIHNVLDHYIGTDIFATLYTHDVEMQIQHRYFLIKAICTKYVNIRVHYIVKRQSEQMDPVRSHLTKTILFRGQ